MEILTLGTGQKQFVWTINHITKVVQLMYNISTSGTLGGISKEFILSRFRSTHFHRCRRLMHSSIHPARVDSSALSAFSRPL